MHVHKFLDQFKKYFLEFLLTYCVVSVVPYLVKNAQSYKRTWGKLWLNFVNHSLKKNAFWKLFSRKMMEAYFAKVMVTLRQQMDTVFSLTALVWRSNEKTETPKKWLIGMLSTRDDIINSILCSTRNIPNTYFKLSGDVSTIIERLLQACSRDSQFSEILGRLLMEKRLGLIF